MPTQAQGRPPGVGRLSLTKGKSHADNSGIGGKPRVRCGTYPSLIGMDGGGCPSLRRHSVIGSHPVMLKVVSQAVAAWPDMHLDGD
jgi:hypothetical protein